MTAPSTTVQWTVRLEDAALIHETLLEAAKAATNAADYLESDRYAVQQRAKLPTVANESLPAASSWELSAHDREQITKYRSKAIRLHRLAGA